VEVTSRGAAIPVLLSWALAEAPGLGCQTQGLRLQGPRTKMGPQAFEARLTALGTRKGGSYK
jgi:hypothetical protein